jgi:hypothetical protein
MTNLHCKNTVHDFGNPISKLLFFSTKEATTPDENGDELKAERKQSYRCIFGNCTRFVVLGIGSLYLSAMMSRCAFVIWCRRLIWQGNKSILALSLSILGLFAWPIWQIRHHSMCPITIYRLLNEDSSIRLCNAVGFSLVCFSLLSIH